MKNLCFLLLAACLLFSCAKEEVSSSVQQVDQIEKDGISGKDTPTVKDGYLVFDCEKTMEDFIVGLADAEVDPKQIEKIYKFRSYLNHVPETNINEGIFGDEYFAGVLNEDGMVAVGSYVFKMNPATQEVFVIDAGSPKGEINQMSTASNPSELSSKTLSFSFEDDVFGMLDDRDNGCTVQAMGCGESAAPTQKQVIEEKPYCTNNFGRGNFELTVRYSKLAIWKYATAKLELQQNLSAVHRFDFRYYLRWKRRCRENISLQKNDYECDYVPSANDLPCFPAAIPSSIQNGQAKYQFYRGTRPLSKYIFRADARIISVCDQNEMVWTGLAQIRHIY